MGTNKKKSIFFFTDKNSYFFVLFCFRNEKVFDDDDDDDDNHTSMMLDLALVWYVAIGFVWMTKKIFVFDLGAYLILYEKTFVQSLFLFIYFVCIFSRMIEFSEKKKNFLHSLFRWMTFEEFSLFSFDEKTKVTCLCVCVCGCQICQSLFVSRFRWNFAKNNDFVVWFFFYFCYYYHWLIRIFPSLFVVWLQNWIFFSSKNLIISE